MKLLGATVLIILCTRVLYSYEEVAGAPEQLLSNSTERTDIPLTCCMTFMSRKIPRKFVVAYFMTSSQCPQNGVVFLTKKRRHICANPSDAWVQEYINNMKESPQAV